jgi:hypothetical protein
MRTKEEILKEHLSNISSLEVARGFILNAMQEYADQSQEPKQREVSEEDIKELALKQYPTVGNLHFENHRMGYIEGYKDALKSNSMKEREAVSEIKPEEIWNKDESKKVSDYILNHKNDIE